jgi:hypothetical protein
VSADGEAPAAGGKGLPAAALILLLLALGFGVGGLLGGRVFNSGPGFDALDSMLAGIAIGLLVALALGVALARRLDARALWRCAAAALVLVLATGGLLAWLNRGRSEEPAGDPAAGSTMPVTPDVDR